MAQEVSIGNQSFLHVLTNVEKVMEKHQPSELPEHFKELQDPTIKQTGQMLQLSDASIWRLCKKGLLEKYKAGNSARIKRESIEALRNNAA